MNSTTHTAGQDFLVSHYNDLRKDVITRGDYAVTTGSANAYILSIDAQYVAYTTGDTFVFKTNFANSGACTINVNSLGVKSLKDQEGNALGSGAISSGTILRGVYDGTNVNIISGLIPTTSNKGSPEMATDAEVETGTDETRYVNSKQVKVVKNGTYGSLTVSSGPNAAVTNVSSSVLMSTSTICRVDLSVSTGIASAHKVSVQTSPDNSAWTDLYAITGSGGTTSRSIVWMTKSGLYYRVRTETVSTGAGEAATATITYTI